MDLSTRKIHLPSPLEHSPVLHAPKIVGVQHLTPDELAAHYNPVMAKFADYFLNPTDAQATLDEWFKDEEGEMSNTSGNKFQGLKHCLMVGGFEPRFLFTEKWQTPDKGFLALSGSEDEKALLEYDGDWKKID